MFKKFKYIDWFLYISVFLILSLSVVTIYSITYSQADKHLLYNQILFAITGIIIAIAIQVLDYRALKSYALIIYVIGILSLILVLFFHSDATGTARWFDIGFFRLQPSEIFKIVLIITLSAFLSEKDNIDLKTLLYSLGIIALPVFLVIMQPDMGTAIILSIIGLTILIAAGMSKKLIIYLLLLIGSLAPLFWFLVLKPYQKLRIISFLNPQSDPFGSGYHVLQSIIAIGSGMILGRGLGKGFQSQLKFLPAPHTDFIFAVLAEGLGIIGVIVLLILFLIVILRLIQALNIVSDKFAYLIISGIITFFLLHIFINIGMNIGIAPVTGVPLPFMSYGGSHVLTGMILIGIVQSIYTRRKKIGII